MLVAAPGPGGHLLVAVVQVHQVHLQLVGGRRGRRGRRRRGSGGGALPPPAAEPPSPSPPKARPDAFPPAAAPSGVDVVVPPPPVGLHPHVPHRHPDVSPPVHDHGVVRRHLRCRCGAGVGGGGGGGGGGGRARPGRSPRGGNPSPRHAGHLGAQQGEVPPPVRVGIGGAEVHGDDGQRGQEGEGRREGGKGAHVVVGLLGLLPRIWTSGLRAPLGWFSSDSLPGPGGGGGDIIIYGK